jgi:signal transduction histidine kinase
MSERIRTHDWSATPLGPIEGWPQSLKTIVGMMIAAPKPMVLLWGQAGTLIYNDGYARFAGRRHPELLGMGAREGWPEIADFNDQNIRRALAGEAWSLKDQELILDRRGSPEPTWMDLDYVPVGDESGRPAGLIVFVTETTDRVQAERRVREEVERQRQMLQQMPGFAAILSGPEHRFDYVNDAYRTLAGDRPLVGLTVREALPDVEGQGYFELLDEVYRTGERFVSRSQSVSLDQEDGERIVDLVYEPIRDASGQVTGIFAGGYDVTEAQAVQSALVTSEARYRRLFDIIDEGFCVIEFIDGPHGPLSDYLHIEANPAFRTNAGIPDIVGKRLREIVGDEADGWLELYRGVLESGRPMRFHKTLEQTGRWLELAAFPINEPGRHQVAVLFKDLTDKMRSERELQTLNATLEERVAERTAELMHAEEALRQSQKMEAIGQLTGGIAHDFNNLLAGISGSLELIEKRMAEGRLAGMERYIQAAQSASRRAATLTQRLLAFSRRQTLDPKPTDVNRLMAGMEDLIRRSVGPDVQVEVEAAVGLWATHIDPSQLENALLNLCINSRDAMAPDGGHLTIRTWNATLDSVEARARDLPPGDYVKLSVTDTGSGMSPEVVAKAFDPFFTTKPIGQGTGLGLSMIHGFMRQSGGQVRIETEVGQGTTITLALPRWTGPAAVEDAPAAETVVEEQGQGETVLVIDDEETVRMLVVEVLEDAGYVALQAADGPAGLAILNSDTRIDLLISDVGLPGGMNGRQVADAARTARPGLKVLFITGYAENAVVAGDTLEPGMAVMTKPFQVAALGTRIREMIEG